MKKTPPPTRAKRTMTPTTTPTAIPTLLDPPLPSVDAWLVASAWPEAVMTIVSPALVMTEGCWDTVVEPICVGDDGGELSMLELLPPLPDPPPNPSLLLSLVPEPAALPTLLS